MIRNSVHLSRTVGQIYTIVPIMVRNKRLLLADNAKATVFFPHSPLFPKDPSRARLGTLGPHSIQ